MCTQYPVSKKNGSEFALTPVKKAAAKSKPSIRLDVSHALWGDPVTI